LDGQKHSSSSNLRTADTENVPVIVLIYQDVSWSLTNISLGNMIVREVQQSALAGLVE
jgi:hypothetical protein